MFASRLSCCPFFHSLRRPGDLHAAWRFAPASLHRHVVFILLHNSLTPTCNFMKIQVQLDASTALLANHEPTNILSPRCREFNKMEPVWLDSRAVDPANVQCLCALPSNSGREYLIYKCPPQSSLNQTKIAPTSQTTVAAHFSLNMQAGKEVVFEAFVFVYKLHFVGFLCVHHWPLQGCQQCNLQLSVAVVIVSY